jgi:hypothetical protein
MTIFTLAGSETSRIGKPNPATLSRLSRFFSKFQGGPKYLGDVDDVDDVPLIIAATPSPAVVYETGNL